MHTIRPAEAGDEDAIWSVLEPTLRAGHTYPFPRDISREDALSFWFGGLHEVFVASGDNSILGTYFLCPNQRGGGDHVANCGYVSAADAQGKGIGRAMLEHSLDHARVRGFRAMQFNFVVASNSRAVKTWQAYGFDVVGTLPSGVPASRTGLRRCAGDVQGALTGPCGDRRFGRTNWDRATQAVPQKRKAGKHRSAYPPPCVH